MPQYHRIVTRGFGPTPTVVPETVDSLSGIRVTRGLIANPITRGFGGLFTYTIEVGRRAIRNRSPEWKRLPDKKEDCTVRVSIAAKLVPPPWIDVPSWDSVQYIPTASELVPDVKGSTYVEVDECKVIRVKVLPVETAALEPEGESWDVEPSPVIRVLVERVSKPPNT